MNAKPRGGTVAKGRKKEKLVAFNRANILEAACVLFQKKGIVGTTMDDIAKAADCSKTTIYSYFKSKEELVSHLALEGIEYFREKVSAEAEKKIPFKEFYKNIWHVVAALQAEHPVYYEGIAGATAFDPSAPSDDILKNVYVSGEELTEIFEKRLEKALAAKEVVADKDVPAHLILMWFCLLGVIEKSALKEDYIKHKLGKSRKEFLEFASDTLFTCLRER